VDGENSQPTAARQSPACGIRTYPNRTKLLRRVDGVPRALARFQPIQAAANIQRHTAKASDDGSAILAGASADDRELRRGLPMIGPGVSGAVPGSDPLGALLAAERRRGRC
jgi:hypothetical protein